MKPHNLQVNPTSGNAKTSAKNTLDVQRGCVWECVCVPISGNKSWEIFQEVFLLSRHSCSIKAPVCVSRLYRRAYFNELYPSLPDCCMLGLPFGVTSILIPSAQHGSKINKPLLTSTGRPYATNP